MDPSPRRGAEVGRQRLPRAARVRSGRQIRAVLRRGKRHRRPAFDVYVLCRSRSARVRSPLRAEPGAETGMPRIGWIVPKLGHRIVDRNRLKRWIRELGRRQALPRLRREGRQVDLLVRVRRKAYEVTYGQAERQFMSVVEDLCSPG